MQKTSLPSSNLQRKIRDSAYFCNLCCLASTSTQSKNDCSSTALLAFKQRITHMIGNLRSVAATAPLSKLAVCVVPTRQPIDCRCNYFCGFNETQEPRTHAMHDRNKTKILNSYMQPSCRRRNSKYGFKRRGRLPQCNPVQKP